MGTLPAWVRWAYRGLAGWIVLAALHNAFARDLDFAPVTNRFAHDVVLLVAGGLCAYRAVRHRGERLAWALIAAGILAWTAGEIYYTGVLWTVTTVPFPSPADAGYLLMPPLVLAGLVLLLRARSRGDRPATAWADGCLAALAAGSLSAAVVFDAAAGSASGDPLGVGTSLAYPLADLVLGSFLIGALAGAGWRFDRTWLLAGLGVLTFGIADSLYVVQTANDTFVSPSWFDAGWWAGLVCLSRAAWEPAPAAGEPHPEDMRLIVMPLLFAVVSLLVLVAAAVVSVNALAVVFAAAALVAVMVRLILTFRENLAMLAASRDEALTDALTGLANRRALSRRLDEAIPEASDGAPLVLVLFDLDGFKAYNDAFGHPAGDALLVRLGANLARYLAGRGTAFRMGGDEFCALFAPGDQVAEPIVRGAAQALSEHGEGFHIGCSYGSIVLPREASAASEALRIADQRMYAQKRVGRVSASRQSKDVLLRALAERNPGLDSHVHDVAQLVGAVADELALQDPEREQVCHAAELHDVGKVAIPDAILDKPGPLDDEEWAFMRRHTLIGERIIAAAPALHDVARLVRSSHERWDGAGYPDGLAGDEIPLGSRIVAVADAFDAMIVRRPYSRPRSTREALAELRRCAGTQFDPVAVEAFVTAWAGHDPAARTGLASASA